MVRIVGVDGFDNTEFTHRFENVYLYGVIVKRKRHRFDLAPEAIAFLEFDRLVIAFDDCDSGTVSFMSADPAIGDGEFEITRLTQSLGDECTGGISDNNPPGAAAINLRDDFVSTGVDDNASGRVKFEQNANHTKLKVWVKKLDEGSYSTIETKRA